MRKKALKRTEVVIPAEDIQRQREFTDKIAALHALAGRSPKAFVDTYGCQQNVADSQRIMGMLRDMGCSFVSESAEADIIVINTCAIRENAQKRVFGVIGQMVHLKEKNPELIICLCGCMAQQEIVAK
ncbi:MAG: tRNA (N6-isopentenyl adenosine(37)-C2)-methylthiotransferase MiaB, partial [Ruminococcaceae bacterium]|nr:tRNA (N6-isopentenyl adenosine(37)-C2)-methylthiotransferase MiaB [Oscillospiraceae bacterium]